MASDIWLRTILIVRKETRCCHIGYSFRLTARVVLYAPSHRQDNTYHSLCYTSCGALAGTRNSSMGPPHEGSIRRPIAPWANALPLSYIPLLGLEAVQVINAHWYYFQMYYMLYNSCMYVCMSVIFLKRLILFFLNLAYLVSWKINQCMPVIFQCFKHLWIVVFNLVYLVSYFNFLNICLLLLGFFLLSLVSKNINICL